MTKKERYIDISAQSGLSEDIIKRVFDATRINIARDLKKGGMATVPGICTLTSEIRETYDLNGNGHPYIKIKAKPTTGFEKAVNNTIDAEEIVQQQIDFVKLANTGLGQTSIIKTKQIAALQ